MLEVFFEAWITGILMAAFAYLFRAISKRIKRPSDDEESSVTQQASAPDPAPDPSPSPVPVTEKESLWNRFQAWLRS